jgi:hypothetical protein
VITVRRWGILSPRGPELADKAPKAGREPHNASYGAVYMFVLGTSLSGSARMVR